MLEQPGLERAAASPSNMTVDDMDTLDEGMLAADAVSVKDCGAVYHRASQTSVYQDGYPYLVTDGDNPSRTKTLYASAEEDLDDTGILYYALYTCSGAAVIAEGYI